MSFDSFLHMQGATIEHINVDGDIVQFTLADGRILKLMSGGTFFGACLEGIDGDLADLIDTPIIELYHMEGGYFGIVTALGEVQFIFDSDRVLAYFAS